jgi:pimeloyl-ACP methyl ester carboxylesterase
VLTGIRPAVTISLWPRSSRLLCFQATQDMHSSEGYLTTEDGVRLFYCKLGDGPRALIIPNGIYLYNDFKYLAASRTLIFYDVRNRGRSETITDASKLARGIHHDVDDLEAVRRHFGISQVDVLGHSYIGLMVALYAMKYPTEVNRVVQIGAMQPHVRKQYPAHCQACRPPKSTIIR